MIFLGNSLCLQEIAISLGYIIIVIHVKFAYITQCRACLSGCSVVMLVVTSITVDYNIVANKRTVRFVRIVETLPHLHQFLAGQVFPDVIVLDPPSAVGCRPQPRQDQQQPHHNMSQTSCHPSNQIFCFILKSPCKDTNNLEISHKKSAN